MTTIRKFKISGLAGRTKDLEESLNPGVNIFWGLNGTGKTTLLRILDAALTNKTSHLLALPFSKAEVVFYSEAHNVEFVRSFDRAKANSRLGSDEVGAYLAKFELEEDPAYRIRHDVGDPGWLTVATGYLDDDEALVSPYKHSYLPISRMLDPLRTERVADGDTADERFVRRVNQVWSRYNSKSVTEVRDIQQLGLAEILAILFGGTAQIAQESQNSRADVEAETEAEDAYSIVAEFLRAQRIMLPLGKRDFMARYEESDQHRLVVTRIRSVMKEVDFVLAPQKELQKVIDEMYIGNKRLLLGKNSGIRNVGIEINDERIPLESLSSGEKQLLQILLETLAVEESTIMIDEPEISLHPDWQVGLVESMRRVNGTAQFLLATHSPELMVGVDDECVFEL